MSGAESGLQPDISSTLCAIRSACSFLDMALARLAEYPPEKEERLMEMLEGLQAIVSMVMEKITAVNEAVNK